MNWCYFGLQVCENIDATQKVGLLLPWFEFVGIAAVMFAVIEFAESSRTRLFLFHLSILKTWTLITVGLGTFFMAFANALPLIPGQALPILSYPATYEALILICFSFLFIGLCIFMYNPYWFRPRFTCSFLRKLTGEFRLRNDKESISSLIKLACFYLEQIVTEAAKYIPPRTLKVERKTRKKQQTEIVEISRFFIDVILTKDEVVTALAQEHSYFIAKFIELAEKYRLWERRVGHLFFENLRDKLFNDETSLLARELKIGGVEGIYKPLSRHIFTSTSIMAHYSPLPYFFTNLNKHSLTLVTECLELALRYYFSKPQESSAATDSPRYFLANAVDRLGECTENYVWKISDTTTKKIWRNDSPQLGIIGGFFSRLEYILSSDEKGYSPQFSQYEKELKKRSVTLALAEAIFKYFQSFSWIKNDIYVRTIVFSNLMWILFDNHSKNQIHKAIQKRFVELIKERVTENMLGNYPSMIKLLANVYGYAPNRKKISSVQMYFNIVFEKEIAPKLVAEEEFRKKHLPEKWIVKGKTITRLSGEKVYPAKKQVPPRSNTAKSRFW